jgi:DNA-binding MarR family transcriptional regulator
MDIFNKFPRIVKYLEKEKKATPSSIAKTIQSDIRTTNKILNSLKEMDLVKQKSFDTGKKKMSLYSLNERRYK